MAPNRGSNRAQDFEDLTKPSQNEFDPEGDDIPNDSSDSEASLADPDAANEAREHYVDVSKSKLRKPKASALGPQYRGSRIGRDELEEEDEDEDDPFDQGFEDEESDEELYDGERAANSGEDENMADGASDSEFSEDETRVPRLQLNVNGAGGNGVEARKAIREDQHGAATSLAQVIKGEAEKGRAVKTQKATFDSLLNTRIKLQKALVGVNTVVGIPADELEKQQSEAQEAMESAELAAFRLWSSLNDIRDELRSARTGEKRKRIKFTGATSTIDLWEHMQKQEQEALRHRNSTLQRWSAKTKSSTQRTEKGVVDKTKYEPTIIDALQESLSNRSRLLKRAHTPRSCAPLQLSNNITTDTKIYDDADFYGLLLKELLEQKSADSIATANIDLTSTLRREAKTKKQVDTKASKGRKLRYTVHEKLQNFMAPEDRGVWSEWQADELFGGLFGRSLGLDEEVEEGGAIGEEEGLMLFQT